MNIGDEMELARHTQFHEVRDRTTYLNIELIKLYPGAAYTIANPNDA
jgi:hypothetical protein